MSHITTYTKIHFMPTEPRREDIVIEDIAHALSLLCRANGHVKRFFSVAQHSLNCAYEAKARSCSKKVRLACLLHDASEAYLSDITRPLKAYLSEYRKYEEILQSMIYDKYLGEPLTLEERKEVKQIDDAMFYYEFLELMGETVMNEKPKINSQIHMESKEFSIVEKQFLNEFITLTGDNGCKIE